MLLFTLSFLSFFLSVSSKRRRPRSARSQDSFVSDNSGSGLPTADGVLMGAEQLTPRPLVSLTREVDVIKFIKFHACC